MGDPIIVHIDNAAAKAWAESSKNLRKAKHIDTRFHFARQCRDSGIIEFNQVGSKDNLADIFTKPLNDAMFNQMKEQIGIAGMVGTSSD